VGGRAGGEPSRAALSGAATTRLRGKTAWARNVAAPVRDFLSTETGGALALLVAALVALLWANSPWSDSYEDVWTTTLSISFGDHTLAMELREWVNEGLMTFFFLVVGLEAKRELDLGSLRERARIIIPVGAALGGMALAALIFLAITGGNGGWGAAISTDTAFALGVLALVAPGGTRLRIRLLTAAVVDDLVALLVIATVYTDHVDVVALLVAIALFAVLYVARGVPAPWRRPLAIVAGVGMWIALHESGIDPLIAGLAIGLITSAYQPARADLEQVTDLARSFREQPTPELARSAELGMEAAISPNERLQYRLHPWTSYVIVPLFALANTGIHIDGDLLGDAITSPITLGIFFGYIFGKPAGIMLGTWLAVRLGRARPAVSWPVRLGGGVVSGIGFTVAILIATLSFDGQELAEAKLGVLATAIASALLAWAVFRVVGHLPATVRARQQAGTEEDIVDLSDDVDPERDHIRGDTDAPVTLVEYGDYECPYCGQAEDVIRQLLAAHDDDVRYVWRHLPLNDVHPSAQLAAEAAEAAAAQGAFWEMHDLLLAHQDELRPTHLRRYAEQLGLDVDRFRDELRRREHYQHIAEDVATADASGVAGTPSFFINGRRHEGAYDIDTLTRAVRAARARSRIPAAMSGS
jgi:Na+/H+ antiporter NhaA